MAEERLKRQEVEVRKEGRDLSAGHKPQLNKMLEDNMQGMQALREDVEAHNKIYETIE